MTEAEPGLGHVARVDGLRIVCLDTTIPGAAGGRIDEARADWLAQALPGEGSVFLAMHHPPVETGITHMDRIGLSGAEVLALHPPLAILAGHVHRAIYAHLGGTR